MKILPWYWTDRDTVTRYEELREALLDADEDVWSLLPGSNSRKRRSVHSRSTDIRSRASVPVNQVFSCPEEWRDLWDMAKEQEEDVLRTYAECFAGEGTCKQ